MTVPAAGRRRGWLAAALAGAAALCLGTGVHLLTEPARATVADAGRLPDGAVVAPPAAARVPVAAGVGGDGLQEVPPRTRTTRRAPARPVPVLPALVQPPRTFRAPALQLRAPVVPVGTDASGALDLPPDTATLGWWVGSALPGSTRGNVVLAGHIDTVEHGPGVMAAVVRQRVGARLQLVDRAGTTITYRVVAVRSYPKTALPAAVFAGTGRPRLVLVTCGGTFDEERHHYSDNVVVYAEPAGA